MDSRLADFYQDKTADYYAYTRPELLPFIPKTIKKALDVGCGSGSFGQTLKRNFNCEVWGIEPDTEAAKKGVGLIDKMIINSFSANMPELEGMKFDCIFFNDVLEHLAEPEKALAYCKALLNNEGCIIASMPNIRWYPVVLSLLKYKDFKYQNAGVMDKTHLRFFTLKSMRRLFENTGYRIITAQGINKDTAYHLFNVLNFLLFNSQWDMKYPQFAIVAKL
jgi:2-polyprenyl-3-methyl-5-hydroxy-6-metoxy-1,4-benzoquinol methylase